MIADQQHWISGYRLMWMLVMFDLPVTEKPLRAEATRFRNFLLDRGFKMAQFSVYFRLLNGKDAADALQKKIKTALPPRGKINILVITDKQYEQMTTYQGRRYETPKKQEQLQLF